MGNISRLLIRGVENGKYSGIWRAAGRIFAGWILGILGVWRMGEERAFFAKRKRRDGEGLGGGAVDRRCGVAGGCERT